MKTEWKPMRTSCDTDGFECNIGRFHCSVYANKYSNIPFGSTIFSCGQGGNIGPCKDFYSIEDAKEYCIETVRMILEAELGKLKSQARDIEQILYN